MFCYDTKEIAVRKDGGKFNFDPSRVDATKQYLTHYANSLYLTFLLNANTTMSEKAQARKELELCDRKLKYWERQPHFEKDRATNGCIELKKVWNPNG